MDTILTASLQRARGEGGNRRAILGAALSMALTGIGLEYVAGKKKRRKKKKKKSRGTGGGNGGGGGQCQFEICNGQCVDIATDPNNCGSCGHRCAAGEVCRLDFCVSEVNAITGAFGLAVTGNNAFAVTSTEIGNIRLIENTTRVDAFDVPGPVQGGEALPTGIAFDTGEGSYVVLDTANSRVIRLDGEGRFAREFGGFGSGQGQFEFPEGVAIDPETGQIFVLDTGNGRVQRFNSNGFFLGQFGRAGSAEGQFQQPRGIAIDAGRNVVVADTGKNRVQILDRSGNVLRGFWKHRKRER